MFGRRVGEQLIGNTGREPISTCNADSTLRWESGNVWQCSADFRKVLQHISFCLVAK